MHIIVHSHQSRVSCRQECRMNPLWQYSLMLVLASVSTIEASVSTNETRYIPTDGTNPQSSGNLFYVGFMVQDKNLSVRILVSTEELNSVSFDVTNSRSRNVIGRHTTTYGSVTKIELSADAFLEDGNNKGNISIRVQADYGKRISVYGFSDTVHSTDGFLGLSCDGMKISTDTLSYNIYEYLVLLSFIVDNEITQSELLIIPCEDDTDIKIYPSRGINYSNNQGTIFQAFQGQYGSWTGNAGETYAIFHEQDLSGTIIRSNKPIVVYAGAQCTQVPPGKAACGHLVEQIPPHTTWGRTHFLNPLPVRESGDRYRIGTVYNNTQVTVTCIDKGSDTRETPIASQILNQTHDQNWLKFVTYETPRRLSCSRFVPKYCCVEATNPVLVVHYSEGYTADDLCSEQVPEVDDSGPFMMVVSPVIQYLNNYTFSASEAPSEHFSIAVHKNFFQPEMVMMDGSPVEADRSQWNPFYCSDGELCGYGISKEVLSGNHTIQHEMKNAALGVSLYGFQQQSSFGLAAGMELQPVSGVWMTCTENVTTSEDVGTITITCTRYPGIELRSETKVLSLLTSPPEATEPEDYTLVNRSLVYHGGKTRDTVGTINITIIDDNESEPNELFLITVTSKRNIIVLTPVIHVTILCDESDGDCPEPVPTSDPAHSDNATLGVTHSDDAPLGVGTIAGIVTGGLLCTLLILSAGILIVLMTCKHSKRKIPMKSHTQQKDFVAIPTIGDYELTTNPNQAYGTLRHVRSGTNDIDGSGEPTYESILN